MEEAITTQEELKRLKSDANEKLRQAEKAWYVLACSLPTGRDREKAFDIYENVRQSTRVF